MLNLTCRLHYHCHFKLRKAPTPAAPILRSHLLKVAVPKLMEESGDLHSQQTSINLQSLEQALQWKLRNILVCRTAFAAKVPKHLHPVLRITFFSPWLLQDHSKSSELYRLTAKLQDCLEKKAALDAAGPFSELHDKKVSWIC